MRENDVVAGLFAAVLVVFLIGFAGLCAAPAGTTQALAEAVTLPSWASSQLLALRQENADLRARLARCGEPR